MNHSNDNISDDVLTLYFYNDGLSDAERRAVAGAIAANPAVAERYRQLSDELLSIAVEPAPPIPADMRARFKDTIDRAAAREAGQAQPARPGTHLPSFFWGAAITAALAIGIGIGAFMGGKDQAVIQPVQPDSVIAEAAEGSVNFTRSVRVHFSDSRRELDRLDVGSDADRILLVAELIAQNRLYEKAAEQNGAPELARVLRAFEPVLARLADEELDAEEAEALLAKLSFELNVMLTKLADAPSTEADTSLEETRT